MSHSTVSNSGLWATTGRTSRGTPSRRCRVVDIVVGVVNATVVVAAVVVVEELMTTAIEVLVAVVDDVAVVVVVVITVVIIDIVAAAALVIEVNIIFNISTDVVVDIFE